MSYRTLLVNLDIDEPIEHRTRLGVGLAKRFGAKLVGFCAADAPLPLASPESTGLAVEAWEQLREDIQDRFKELKAGFELQVGGAVDHEWRDVLDNPTRALIAASARADLVIAGAASGASTGHAFRAVDPGAVLLQSGRPLLVAAAGLDELPIGKIVVAWKNTREARRAVADSLPLLIAAEETIVVTVSDDPDMAKESLSDTAAFLGAHKVKVRTHLLSGTNDSDLLDKFIREARADLIVSGAYGHSRLREWAFGGVTRSLLDSTNVNRFMSS